MRAQSRFCARFFVCFLGISRGVFAGCPDGDVAEDKLKAWLPNTPMPSYDVTPPSHREQGGDCPFYIQSWHNFMYSTLPDENGRAAFLSFPTIANLFEGEPVSSELLAVAPRSIQMPNDASIFSVNAFLSRIAGPATPIDAGIEQAGNAAILFDQLGFPIYYGIHVNDGFAAFLQDNGLTDKTAIESANADLMFPEGVVELKSAWRVLPGEALEDTYITTMGRVPILRIDASGHEKRIRIDPIRSRRVKLGLVALHVVFTIRGHPEFIWSTFEHSDLTGNTDLAPSAADNPDGNVFDPTAAISPYDYLLYHGGASASAAEFPPTFGEQAAAFNEATQRLDRGGAFPASVYRAYPSAKADTIEFDEDLTEVNAFILEQFLDGVLPAADKRKYYRLVGATWLDEPDKTFLVDKSFDNDPGQSSDDGIVAGEARLSSTAMESWTQTIQPNCFSCHDTHAVTTSGGDIILNPKRLNVSHILSKYVGEH